MTYPKSPLSQKVTSFDCGLHEISYIAIRAGCPLCDMERQIKGLREALQDANGKANLALEELRRLRAQTDVVWAMKEATALLDDNDMAFLKTVLYQWRDNKSVGLKPTFAWKTKGKQRNRTSVEEESVPNGFIVIPRSGDPWSHPLSSMGGLAIADNFNEAVNSVGSAQAMQFLVRAMADHLPGSIA